LVATPHLVLKRDGLLELRPIRDVSPASPRTKITAKRLSHQLTAAPVLSLRPGVDLFEKLVRYSDHESRYNDAFRISFVVIVRFFKPNTLLAAFAGTRVEFVGGEGGGLHSRLLHEPSAG